MTFFILTSYLNSVSSVIFGVFVYLKNPKKSVNRIFFLLAMAVGLWAAGIAGEVGAPNSHVAFTWLRVFHIGVCLIPISFFHFSMEVIEAKEKQFVLLGYLISAFFILMIPSKLFIVGVQKVIQFPFYLKPGPLYHLFMIYFVGFPALAEWKLWHASKLLKGNKSKQALYVFFAGLIGFIGGLTSYLPAYNVRVYPLMNGFVFMYVLLLAISVLKHHLMDIEVIIKRTLVFAGIVAVAVGAVSIPLALVQLIVGRAIGVSPFLLMVSGIAIAVLVYRPLARWLVDLTDKFLFQKKYDYRKLLKDASAGISQIKSLRQLLSLVTHFVTMRVRAKNAAVIVHDEANDYFKLVYLRGYPKVGWLREGHIFNQHDPFIDYLTHERIPLDIERVKERIQGAGQKLRGNGRGKNRHYAFDEIKQRMSELQAACCVPSFLGERLRNILILGEKKSGDVYSDEDLNVLYTLAQESAIAIENARLYDEAIEKAKELETINDNLNDAQTKLIRALSDAEAANKKLQVTQACLIVAEKNATMVGMAKAIGHEVNNPLSIVIGRVERIEKERIKRCVEIDKKATPLLEKDGVFIPREDFERMRKLHLAIEDDARKATKAAHRINTTVRTMTNILMDTKGEIEPLSVTVLCQEVLEATRFTTYEENLSGCEIRLDITSNLEILGDLQGLLQVFVNLIKNAFEAMLNQRERVILISGDVDTVDSKMAKIEVCDNGPGIPPDVLPKIWKQGFSTKVRKDDSIGAAGQGQGLYVCKHIIESVHKGLIDVESELGRGTRFIIKLPLAEPDEET